MRISLNWAPNVEREPMVVRLTWGHVPLLLIVFIAGLVLGAFLL